MSKLIVFDFDKTLTDYDTTFAFFLFCSKKKGKKYFLITFCFLKVLFFFIKILSKCKILSVKKEKEIGLIFFCPRKISDFIDACVEFSKIIVLNELYYNVFVKTSNSPENKIVIASASFQCYLEFLFPNYKVIGTTLLTGKSGKIIGINSHPFKEEKLIRLRNEGFFNITDFYTDSLNDMPTTTISQHVFWIKNGKIIN